VRGQDGVVPGPGCIRAGEEVESVAPIAPALSQLAGRLRELREESWRDYQLTQAMLASALADGGSLASATVSSWESQVSPKLPPQERLIAYARFFATRRSVEGAKPHLLPLDDLTDEENEAREALEDELLTLRERALRPLRDKAPIPALRPDAPPRRSWQFAQGPVNIVCAQLPEKDTSVLADPSNPNYTELQQYADLDSLLELHGHLCRENPEMGVFFKASTGVVPDDLSGHVVLLGGIAWNEITDILSEMTVLPVRQVRDEAVPNGEIFVADVDGKERKFLPRWRNEAEKENLRTDVGLLARTRNPLNSNRTLTICNGVHSRGVYGAVRSLTDARLRVSNEQYLAEKFRSLPEFAILVRVTVIEGKAMTPDFNTPGSVLYHWPESLGD
jgi:hypothetical protein